MSEFPHIPVNAYSMGRRKLVGGFGINDSNYLTNLPVLHHANKTGRQLHCPYYTLWTNLINRCYSPYELAKNPTYLGCSVSQEWRSFMSFREWAVQHYRKGLELDKDLLVKGNKVYGPETCSFVPRDINALFNANRRQRGEHPIGVYFYKRDKMFMAAVSSGGKTKNLGLFSTPEEAHLAYLNGKAAVIRQVIKKYESDPFLVSLLTPWLHNYQQAATNE